MIDLSILKELNIDELKRTDLGSQLNFISASETLENIKSKLLLVENIDKKLTISESNFVDSLVKLFLSLCTQILEFSHLPGEDLTGAQNRRGQLIELVNQLEIKINGQFLPLYTFVSFKENDHEKQAEEIINQIKDKYISVDQQLSDKFASYDKQFNDKNSVFQISIDNAQEAYLQSREILQKAENFSTTKLVDKYGDIFEKQAKRNKNISIASIIIFILSVVGVVILAYFLFTPILYDLRDIAKQDIKIEYLITNLIFRVTLISLALLFIKESLKNFNVNMHLYNLNKHRQNSLLSFDTFISNTTDDNTRNYLIKEISKTIYSVNQIGYLSDDKKSFNVNQLVDIIKVIGHK